jgi:hypothetical protein
MTPEPPDDADPRPWELGLGVRRDCETHRGVRLLLLAAASVVLTPAGLLLTSALDLSVLDPVPLRFAVLLASLVPALCLAGGVAWAASRDVARMHEGLLDPSGLPATEAAGLVGGLLLGFTVACLVLLVSLAALGWAAGS